MFNKVLWSALAVLLTAVAPVSAQYNVNGLEDLLVYQEGGANFINASTQIMQRQNAYLDAQYYAQTRSRQASTSIYQPMPYENVYTPTPYIGGAGYDSWYGNASNGRRFPSGLDMPVMGRRNSRSGRNYSGNRNSTVQRIFGSSRQSRGYDTPDLGARQATKPDVIGWNIGGMGVSLAGDAANFLQERSHHKAEMAQQERHHEAEMARLERVRQEVRGYLDDHNEPERYASASEQSPEEAATERPSASRRVSSCRSVKVVNCAPTKAFIGTPDGKAGAFLEPGEEQNLCLPPNAKAWKSTGVGMTPASTTLISGNVLLVK